MSEPSRKSEFERLNEEKQVSLVSEFYSFIRHNKAYWMIPILLSMALLGLLATLSTTGAAPFIYTLF